MISEKMRLAVNRGAYFMDEYMPNWAEKINLNGLNMQDCEQCIIGQTMVNYHDGLDAMFGDMYIDDRYEWAQDHGFDMATSPHVNVYMTSDEADRAYKQEYSNLEVVWTEEVRKRLG